MDVRCKILRTSHKDYVINEEVCSKIQQAVWPHEDLLTIVKRLQWYGHVSCSSGLCSKPEMLSKIAQMAAALTRLKLVSQAWNLRQL